MLTGGILRWAGLPFRSQEDSGFPSAKAGDAGSRGSHAVPRRTVRRRFDTFGHAEYIT